MCATSRRLGLTRDHSCASLAVMRIFGGARSLWLLFATAPLFIFGSACGTTSRDYGPTGNAGGDAGASDTAGDAGSGLPAGGSGVDGGTSGVAGSLGTIAGTGGVDESLGGDPGSAGAQPMTTCGNGSIDAGEDCDLGAKNAADAYGPAACTDQCKKAPYCGDSKKNGPEICDEGGSGSELGSCNPECTGYYEKKFLRLTNNTDIGGSFGGIAGADAKCVEEFGVGWKALLVGGSRRATVTPLVGDGAKDWVIHKYTHYYSSHEDKLIWRTDDVALLGVRDKKRVNVYANAFSGQYPWSGWRSDWTTYPENTPSQGTCAGWTSTAAPWGSIALADLTSAAGSETCGSGGPLLCVEQ